MPKEIVTSGGLFTGVAISLPAAPTNLFTQQNAFDHSDWSKHLTTIAANSTAAPDGTVTADTVTFAASSAGYVQQGLPSLSAATAYTFSVYARTLSGTKDFRFKLWDNSTESFSADKTATTEWQQFSHTFTTGAGGVGCDTAIRNVSAATAGDLIIWGAVFQLGSSATPLAHISTYTLTADDVEELLYCEVTATNVAGSAMKQSDATGEVADAWFPTELADLVAWYDADDSGSMTQASTKISQWNDKSGNGYHMLQATGANQPTYVASAINSMPAVHCTGSPVFMEASVPAGEFASGLTWYIVFQKTGAAQGFETPLTRGGAGTTVDQYNDARLGLFFSGTSTLNFATATTPTLLIQKAGNSGVDTSINGLEEWANGVSVLDSGSRAQETDSGDKLILATRTDRFTNGRMYISEIICCGTAHDSTTRGLVSDYLNAKWGF